MIPRRFFFAVAKATVSATLLAIVFALAGEGASAQTEPGPTLAQVLKRGYLSCGVSDAAGFAQPDDKGVWRGFDVDYCHAVAAAIFDDPAKVRFLGLGAKERVSALQSGWVDLLASAAPWTQSRDGAQRIVYAGVSFYDGQSFLVRRQRSFASAQDLANVSVCVQQGTSHELELADFFRKRKTPYEAKLFATFEDAVAGYDKQPMRRADRRRFGALRGARQAHEPGRDHDVLPDLLTKAPRGPIVRQGDDQWFSPPALDAVSR